MNKWSIDQIRGCLFGCAYGDAMGAHFEGGRLERWLWKLIGKADGQLRYTDDTQMTLDMAESLLSQRQLNQDHLAMTFANSYRWSRGYGPGAARTLKLIKKGMPWQQAAVSQFADGSYGNGAAMRAPVLALFFDQALLQTQIERASVITHAHPEAIEGAILVGLTTKMALQQLKPEVILQQLLSVCALEAYRHKLQWLSTQMKQTDTVQQPLSQHLGNGIEAKNSCITAIAYALLYIDQPYLSMFEVIRDNQGDVDTIAAMAGAIWGGYNGYEAMPKINIESQKKIMDTADNIANFALINGSLD